MSETTTFTPHPLVQEVNEALAQQGLEPIAQVSEDGIEVNAQITDSQARLAINRDLRRRLVTHQLETGEQTVQVRSFLYNDGLDKTWMGQLKLDVIPTLAQMKKTSHK